jgi:hypothetical protein
LFCIQAYTRNTLSIKKTSKNYNDHKTEPRLTIQPQLNSEPFLASLRSESELGSSTYLSY